MKSVSFQEYVKEVLRRATYKKGRDLPCVVAVAPDLPGCLTQGDDFEEARENLIDAIQLWITSALRDGESLPIVNGQMLVTARTKVGRPRKRVSHA
jgi:predicted RNase H-like HicB family nuclease